MATVMSEAVDQEVERVPRKAGDEVLPWVSTWVGDEVLPGRPRRWWEGEFEETG